MGAQSSLPRRSLQIINVIIKLPSLKDNRDNSGVIWLQSELSLPPPSSIAARPALNLPALCWEGGGAVRFRLNFL